MHRSMEEGAATGISEGSTFVKPHKRKGASAGSSGGRVPAHKQAVDHGHSYPGVPAKKAARSKKK
jgi:hypothetical protein